ncbi:hypothetical protein ABIB62_002679 [Mucilaginibacter sp. UYP25]
MGLFKVNSNLLIIKIISCADGLVNFVFPLRNDGKVLTAFQHDIYLPLKELAKYPELGLKSVNPPRPFTHRT